MFEVNNKDTRTTSMMLFWCFYCQLLTYFTSFPKIFIVNFELINVCWAIPEHMFLWKLLSRKS